MTGPVEQARRIQSMGANPERSVVLEAAAGAGKTKVLVDRYLRLCLGGAGESLDPRMILAITFTRKATIEIQARLQQQAQALVCLPADERLVELRRLLDREPLDRELARSAWFHETLLEDAAGLGIETLHAFCQRILGRFAAEAGLDPHFTVLEEQAELAYRTEALDRLELELGHDPQAAAAQAELASTAAGARARIASFFDRRVTLQRWLDRVCPPEQGAAAALVKPLLPCLEALTSDLQVALLGGTALEDSTDCDPAALSPAFGRALRDLLDEGLDQIAAADGGAVPTSGLANQIAQWRGLCNTAVARLASDPTDLPDVLSEVRRALLTDAGKLRAVNGRKQTKAARQATFARAVLPVLRVAQQVDLLDLLRKNRILLRHGLRALDIHASVKRRDRVVDFQDLEYLALRLLTDPNTGPQIHFRLDARLDHLLLDEFQDTNRNQWDLLRPLFEEILSGGDRPRTVLVVGDVKQSIYGFRGADPTIFGDTRTLVRRQAGDQAVLQLPTNFRSLPAIVEAVGELFQREPLAGYLGDAASGARQEAARTDGPGQVVCVRPFKRSGDQSGHQRAADALVELIHRLTRDAMPVRRWDAVLKKDSVRDLAYEDILILTRNKTRLAVYEAALRRAAIPFTPAGRGLLARCREVQDVLALLRWLTYPADDAAGAAVLRSPICRLPEQQVQALLAQRLSDRTGTRRRSLQEVLQASACQTGQHEQKGALSTKNADDLFCVSGRVLDWFRLAGRLPLHDLLRRIYREAELLERFEVAHGEQARFNLLRLLDLALAAEANGGSLRDFADELEQAARLGGQEEGALPAEQGGGRVRIMTIHGAKGLQAPVVLLADAATPVREATEELNLGGRHTEALGPATFADAAARDADGPWVHGVRKEHWEGPALHDGACLPGILADYRRQAVDRIHAEEAQILYVALTRARDRLIVLGGVNDRQTDEQAEHSYLGWLAKAGAGLAIEWRNPEDLLSDPAPSDRKDPAASRQQADARAAHGASAGVFDRRAAVVTGRLVLWEPPRLQPRFMMERPSQLDDDHDKSALLDADRHTGKDQAGRSRGENPAVRRGTRIHALLERACYLGRFPSFTTDPDQRAEWEEALAVWEDSALAWVFAPDTASMRGRNEVPILHRIADEGVEKRRRGIIDRLIIRPDRVDIIDYKTNRFDGGLLESVTAVYRPQLLAYRDAVAVLYTDRTISCWLLWTAPGMAGRRLTEVC